MIKQELAHLTAEETVQRYGPMVYRIALSQTKNKEDAEDVFQEVFLSLIRSNPSLESEEHRKAWLIRVTLNCCKKHFRSMKKVTIPLTEDIPCEFTPEEEDVYRAVLSLPQKYKAVIHLFYYEDLPVKEIGEILDIKENAVKTRLFRARQMLQPKLREMFEQYE